MDLIFTAYNEDGQRKLPCEHCLFAGELILLNERALTGDLEMTIMANVKGDVCFEIG